MGFRYKKEVNGETHNYIFDGWSITAETNKDGELKSREVRGYGLVKKEIDNNQYYYHQNEHGDITHLTNIDEEIENSYQYDVFGNIREQQENVENVFKYAGEQLDNETQQYYLRARFYNPVIARFTQEDIYRDDGLNLYVYVVNNPLLWIDPSGYKKQCTERRLDRIPDGQDYYDNTFEPHDLRVIRERIREDGVLVNTPNGQKFFAMEELQKITDKIHREAFKNNVPKSRIEDNTTKYTYKGFSCQLPLAVTIAPNGHVFVSSVGNIPEQSKKVAQDIFGSDNVTVISNSTKYKLDSKLEIDKKSVIMSEEFINNGLNERKEKFANKRGKEIKGGENLSTKIGNKFKFGDGHAEVGGIQGIKDELGSNAVRYSVQFCSHLSCPSCSFIQIHEKVINCTGFSENTKTLIYTRDYKK